MTLDHNEPEGTWIPLCGLCNWKGETHPEQGKAQSEYQRHCKTPEHKKNKEKAAEETLLGGGEGAGPGGETPSPGEKPPEPPEKDAMPGAPAIETLTEEEVVLFHGEEGIQRLKRAKLEKSLTITPKMTPNIKTWVLAQYDQDNAAQVDYNALYMLLISSQIPPQFAQRIVQNIMTMEQRLRSHLQQRQQANTPFFSPWQPHGAQSSQPVFIMTPHGQLQQIQTPSFNNPANTYGQPAYLSYSPQTKEIEKLEKTAEGLKAAVEALKPKESDTLSKEDVTALIAAAVEAAREKPEQVTKEDIVEIFKKLNDEKDKEDNLKILVSEFKGLRSDVEEIRRRPTSTPMPKDVSEAGSIEIKKLDIIGDKLGDLHDTIKLAVGSLLQTEGRPRSRSGEDITRLDSELDKIAQAE